MATNLADVFRPNLRDIQTFLTRNALPVIAQKLAVLVEATNALNAPTMTPEEFVVAMVRYEQAARDFRVTYMNQVGLKNFLDDVKQTERSAQMLMQEGRRVIRQEKAWAEEAEREAAEAEQAARDAEARAIREAEEKVQRDKEEADRIRRLLADNPDSGEANRIRQMLNLPPAPVS
jgi:hypothetical protein